MGILSNILSHLNRKIKEILVVGKNTNDIELFVSFLKENFSVDITTMSLHEFDAKNNKISTDGVIILADGELIPDHENQEFKATFLTFQSIKNNFSPFRPFMIILLKDRPVIRKARQIATTTKNIIRMTAPADRAVSNYAITEVVSELFENHPSIFLCLTTRKFNSDVKDACFAFLREIHGKKDKKHQILLNLLTFTDFSNLKHDQSMPFTNT